MAPLPSILLLQLLFVLVLSAATDCYYPNGTLSKDTVSCWGANGRVTGLCCKPGDLCFDSKICAQRTPEDPENLTYYRGNCYDRRWFASSCPKFCIESDDRAQLPDIARCPDDSTRIRWFCGNKSVARLVNDCDDLDTFTMSGKIAVRSRFRYESANFNVREYDRLCHRRCKPDVIVHQKLDRGKENSSSELIAGSWQYKHGGPQPAAISDRSRTGRNGRSLSYCNDVGTRRDGASDRVTI